MLSFAIEALAAGLLHAQIASYASYLDLVGLMCILYRVHNRYPFGKDMILEQPSDAGDEE